MNLSLDRHLLVGHWVPGFVVVMALRPLLFGGSSAVFDSLFGGPAPGGEAISVLAVVVLSLCAGETLDALRDLLEHVWDRLQPLRWDFFVTAGKDKVDSFRASYFTFYVFDCNISLALLALVVLIAGSSGFSWVAGLPVPFLVVFAWNARSLRKEMSSVMRTEGA